MGRTLKDLANGFGFGLVILQTLLLLNARDEARSETFLFM